MGLRWATWTRRRRQEQTDRPTDTQCFIFPSWFWSCLACQRLYADILPLPSPCVFLVFFFFVAVLFAQEPKASTLPINIKATFISHRSQCVSSAYVHSLYYYTDTTIRGLPISYDRNISASL